MRSVLSEHRSSLEAMPRAICAASRSKASVLGRRSLVGWILALALAATAQASQDPKGFEEPRFFIEGIHVEGAQRSSPKLVLLESLLVAGQEYRESELVEAVNRIQRLPFIFDAGFSLEKGSERGKLELTITVKEVARFFFGADSETTVFVRDLALERSFASDTSTDLDVLAGMRFFMGQYGVFFAAVSSAESVQLGLTRYQVFGRRVFVSLGLLRQGCCPATVRPLGLDPTFSSWTSDSESTRGNFTLGVPLRGDHSLRFDASRFESPEGSRRLVLDPFDTGTLDVQRDLVDQRIELAWLYDSSDDPNFPTEGRFVSVAYELREARADFAVLETVDGEPSSLPTLGTTTLRSQLHRLVLVGTQHWPVSHRHTLSASLRLSAGVSDVENVPLEGQRVLSSKDLSVLEANLVLRHSMRLWRARRHLDYQELRWENVFEAGHEATSPSLGLLNNPLDRWSFRSSLAFRSTWGVARLGLAVEDVGRDW